MVDCLSKFPCPCGAEPQREREGYRCRYSIGLAMSNVAALSSANNECLRVPPHKPPLSPPSAH